MSDVMRLCLGCGTPGPWGRSGRCDDCTAERHRTAERNPARRAKKAGRYDHSHRRLRAVWATVIASGERVFCARETTGECLHPGQPIGPLDPWDLDHFEYQSLPSHADCNRRATVRKATPS